MVEYDCTQPCIASSTSYLRRIVSPACMQCHAQHPPMSTPTPIPKMKHESVRPIA